ncbi:MAG TPA: FAD-binding and (Fe-S)-binding domain-containing protein [Anaeromyxobacter sp.]|nr:FAD-binding and (Fe-S)-binding domain-containing protein [Anaeromyxobacter sp.]
MRPAPSTRADVQALPGPHRRFYEDARAVVPPERLFCDPLRTLAYGTDASFYRLVPKVVARVRDVEEVRALLALARRHGVPLTFRAAGTSLSGQAVTDSVLVQLDGWKGRRILDGGAAIVLGPGVAGGEANAALAPLGRKIGPDPASIATCQIGGIAANNASGMCCGTAQNSYRTVRAMKLVLADGTFLDTADPAHRRRLRETHAPLLDGLAAIRRELLADAPLAARVREKYRIKNTTGYGLNSFLDFEDPVDVLLHLMVGSEGTLAFIAEVTFETVEEHAHRASALVLFPDVETAARGTQRLAGGPVSAVELMDRASLRSVEARPGLPPVLRTLPPDACALLVEVRAAEPAGVARAAAAAAALLEGLPTLEPVAFTAVKAEYERLWDVRRGLFPAVGAARRVGTTVVIEDVAFPMAHLAAGAVELRRLFAAHGYDEGIVFGHALDGNLHFVFTQDFGDAAEVERYRRFMDEVCEVVVRRFDGSLKGEHGTGRNMAPFVELEWGAAAYGIMRRVKALLDPDGLLNPGVVLNDDPRAHVKNLKPLPRAAELVDRCTECGFCEPRCPSRALSLTPRQRIVIRREVARLRAPVLRSGGEGGLVLHGEGGGGRGAHGGRGRAPAEPAGERIARLERDYAWLGDETCAADGLCATACPVGIDTGKLTKARRAEARGALAERIAGLAARRFGWASAGVRTGLAAARALGTLPVLPGAAPGPARGGFEDLVRGRDRKVVYLPSCVVRTMGPARGDPDPRALQAAMLSVLDKAGYDVRFPSGLGGLCCGLSFESKGFPRLADEKARELERALLAATEGGRLPVVCDTSPCVQRMRATLDPRLALHEPAEFIHDRLMDRLRFRRRPGPVALHVTCSAIKMGLEPKLRAVAEACAEQVVVPPTGCCGFAGDKGFTTPELTASALAGLRAALPPGCERGYSSSRACEIGLTTHAGVPYQSIVYLVDAQTSPAEAAAEGRAAGGVS